MYHIHLDLNKSSMDDLSSYIILPINTQFLSNVVSGTHINESDNCSSSDKMYANIEYYVSPSSEIENVYVNSSEMQSGHFVSNDFVDNNEVNGITYKCSICETIFNKYDLYLVHLQSHRNNTAFQCKKCNKTFDEMNAFHKHIMEHQEDKLFRCLICHAGFNIENNFKVHMALHGNSSQCPICEISFQRMASLKSHLAIHQMEELHICSECSSEFESMASLKKHIKTHISDVLDQHRDLTCNICKVKFETSVALKDHISSHLKVKKLVHNGKCTNKNQMGHKEYKHKCSICSKTFPKLSLLERHTRIHSGERPYVCSICDKGFTQKGTLQIHMTKHSGLKPFCCTLCPAKFNQKCNLKVHVQKTHTATTEDEKIFKCSQCDCIFKRITSLNAHMTKIHATDTAEISIASIDHPNNIDKRLLGNITDSSNSNIPQSSENQLEMNAGEKLPDGGKIFKIYSLKQKFLGKAKVYICSYCDKEIKKPSDLIRHLRTHTKEKPFKCFCGNSFSVKSTLLTHMQIHKGNNGKKCSICSKVLFTMKAWNAHLRKHGSSSQSTISTIQNCQSELLDESGKHLNPSVKSLDGQHRLVSLLKKVNMKRNIYSGDRKYKCRVCQRSFITPFSVKEHMKLHSDVQNWNVKHVIKHLLLNLC
ncbi:hypothetical protein WA026_017790 [Henosepilachna vigintioctopunctata]|uniref:C2H2-type domain-containing protein n=1 Tax=Henosepilachna vigintioctopunctata TaxID=420089 RepID=A0AAW1UDR4_9CUCU